MDKQASWLAGIFRTTKRGKDWSTIYFNRLLFIHSDQNL